MAAYDTITQDLERHVLHDAAHHRDRQYALFSGVQIHGPDGSDMVSRTSEQHTHQRTDREHADARLVLVLRLAHSLVFALLCVSLCSAGWARAHW